MPHIGKIIEMWSKVIAMCKILLITTIVQRLAIFLKSFIEGFTVRHISVMIMKMESW